MKSQELKSNVFLLITAAIWGLAFVAQRVGAAYVQPFMFNGIRFLLGSLSLIPLILYLDRKSKKNKYKEKNGKVLVAAGVVAGLVLFAGASLQQAGMAYTTAGKAAFITGLYIVLVPVFGLFLQHKIKINAWIGVGIAIVGLYLLSVTETFTISFGDLVELIGALFWAAHILLIDYFAPKVNVLKLAFIQFITCAVISLAAGFIFETNTLSGIMQAAIPILYGGICSVGIAYTLQVVGQKHAQPSHAAIILSMETVFASLGGLIILGELLDARGYVGCALMLSGMLLSQVPNFFKRKDTLQ